MKGFQRVEIMGNIGSDPEFKDAGGTPLLKFSVAVNSAYRKDDPPEWFNVAVWGPLADGIRDYVSKGDPIFVVGEQRTRKYEDKDGREQRWVEINAETVRLLGGGKENERESGNQDRGGGRGGDRSGSRDGRRGGGNDRNNHGRGGGGRDDRNRNDGRNRNGGGRGEQRGFGGPRRDPRDLDNDAAGDEHSGEDDNPFR